MDTTFIIAMAGVLGSLVGGSATVATAWVTRRTLGTRELNRVEISKREALYGEFIEECAKLLFAVFMHTLEKPGPLLPVASDSVLGEACRAELKSMHAGV